VGVKGAVGLGGLRVCVWWWWGGGGWKLVITHALGWPPPPHALGWLPPPHALGWPQLWAKSGPGS
jgi:hypothetical protein